MEKDMNFKKNFIWNVLGTGFNSFNSLFLLIIVTRLNGVNEAGIYAIAFSTACVLYVIGTYAGRIFQVTEKDSIFTDKDFIVNRVISTLIMMICTVIFVIFRRYDLYKSVLFLLLALYKALEAFSDVLYGIMQKRDLLYKVGQSYFIKSILTLSIFGIVDVITKNLIFACICVILVWILVIVLFDIINIREYINFKEKIHWKNSLIIFKNGIFIFFITFMSIYVLNAPKYAIDSMLDNSYQTIFGIIVMPATAICLLGQFLIHPYLNKFVELNQQKKYKDFNKLQFKIIFYLFGFGMVSSIGAYIVGIPILQLIYGVDLQEYRILLTSIIIAATFYNIAMIFSNILTTMRHMVIQFVIYLVTSVIALISSNVLTRLYGIQGATGAYFIIMLVLFILYVMIEKILKKSIFNKSIE